MADISRKIHKTLSVKTTYTVEDLAKIFPMYPMSTIQWVVNKMVDVGLLLRTTDGRVAKVNRKKI